MEIGKILKEKRISCGMSQQELADRAGVTKRAVNYWENGKRKMTIESADRVFKAMDMPLILGKNSKI